MVFPLELDEIELCIYCFVWGDSEKQIGRQLNGQLKNASSLMYFMVQN